VRSLVRNYAEIERAPVSSKDTLGTINPTTSYGSEAKSSQDLIGLTANEQPEMLPPMRFWRFDQMRKEDAAVKSALQLYKLPIKSAQYPVQPADETPEDRMVADALQWNFGLDPGVPGVLDLSWREQLAQALLMLDYGCMFEEIVVGDVDVWYDADGDPHPMRPFSRLLPLFPQTVKMPDGIQTDKQKGTISSLVQDLPKVSPVPGDKLSWHVLDREGSDWFGTSLLRPMYGPWRLKRAVMISAGIGWDRFAFGTPVIRYPVGGGDMKKREAEDIGRNWRAAERGYFVLEGTELDGWAIDVKGGSGSFNDPTPLIHAYDEQIAGAALQNFMTLGISGSGSRAVGDALSEPYYLALQALCDDIIQDKQRRVFRKWVDLNFGPEYDLPKINPSKLTARNVAVLAAAIAALSDAGLSFTDANTVNDIREWLDLRTLPVEAQEAAEEVLDEFPDDVGLEATTNGGPAAPNPENPPPPQRIPQVGATTSSGRPQLAQRRREGEGLGY
jgi:hypothetical protein